MSKKKWDPRCKLLVFGFHRNVEKELLLKHRDNTFYNIPQLVIYQSLSFYHSSFKLIYDKEQYKIHQDDINTITKYKNCVNLKNNCVFIGEWMDKNINTLKLRINKLDAIYTRDYFIGIVPNEPNEWNVKKWIGCAKGSYYYSPSGTTGRILCGGESWDCNKDKCLEGDVLSIILDFKSGKILYKIEGNDGIKHGVLFWKFDTKNKKYKFAMSMNDTQNSVTILDICES